MLTPLISRDSRGPRHARGPCRTAFMTPSQTAHPIGIPLGPAAPTNGCSGFNLLGQNYCISLFLPPQRERTLMPYRDGASPRKLKNGGDRRSAHDPRYRIRIAGLMSGGTCMVARPQLWRGLEQGLGKTVR